MIRCQSSTPSPQAQPTGVPVTLPRSASAWDVGDVLGVQVHQPPGDALEPGIDVMAAQVGVARVEIDADGGRLHQVVDPVKPVGMARVLGVRLQPDLHAPPLGDERRLLRACT